MQRRQLLKQLSIGLALTCDVSGILAFAQHVRRKDWAPVTIGQHELQALADAILPRTKTPGALDAGVPAFIEAALKALIEPQEQTDFYLRLETFTDACQTVYGEPFHQLNETEKASALDTLITADKAFFTTLKYWILTGYYTSEEGMTEALHYNPTPGKYESCLQVTSETKTEASYF